MKAKYYGFFSANNDSTYNREPYEFTNFRTACRHMRAIARGNHFNQPCNTSTWSVYNANDYDNNPDSREAIKSGTIRS